MRSRDTPAPTVRGCMRGRPCLPVRPQTLSA